MQVAYVEGKQFDLFDEPTNAWWPDAFKTLNAKRSSFNLPLDARKSNR